MTTLGRPAAPPPPPVAPRARRVTSRALLNKPGPNPLLVGVLAEGPPAPDGRPTLDLLIWCPFCRTTHRHGGDEFARRHDGATRRVPHCEEGGYLDGFWYWVGLDELHAVHNSETSSRFRRATAEWREAVELIAEARNRGVRLGRDGLRLVSIAPPGAVDDEFKARLSAREGTIRLVLGSPAGSLAGAPPEGATQDARL